MMRTKEEILDLLSDEAVARVANVEANGALADGALFIDLDVTRDAVSDETWQRIEDALAA